jgi:putative pyridoxal-dependent aspartate 1-decarboxylase
LYTKVNSTDFVIPAVSIAELFYQQVAISANATALIYENQSISYAELDRRSNQVANNLIRNGIITESLVVISMERSIDLITGILGILKAGGTYVPIDPSYPTDLIDTILSECKPSCVITHQKIIDSLNYEFETVLCLERDWPQLIEESVKSPPVKISHNSRFILQYTSGSTGHPKGVEGLYRGIINRLFWTWETYPFTGNEICCHKTSIGFIDHVAEIFVPLLKGIPLVIFPEQIIKNNHSLLTELINFNVTRLTLVPSQLQSLLQCDISVIHQLSRLKYVFSSGEALTVKLAKLFFTLLPHSKLINIYGTTEVSADVLFYEIKKFILDDVLKYFTQTIDLPGALKESIVDNSNNPISPDRVTSPNISIEEVAAKFLSTSISDYPVSLEQYVRKLYTDVLPYVINTAAPTFIGHMTSALPDFVHDLSKLISQLNQNLVKIETAKSLIFLEREALAILHRTFYKRDNTFYTTNTQRLNSNLGLITTGGTTANITALLTARNKALFGSLENCQFSRQSIYSLLKKNNFEDMTILGTKLMHYSMRKAISVLGIGIDTIQYVETTIDGKIDLNDLVDKIEQCRKNNILILALVGIAGTTETGQIDPLEEMSEIARKYGIHFHVDAAWGGTTVFSDTYSSLLKGIDSADSITFCGHKQLYLPQGISICLFKDPDQLQYSATASHYQASANTYDAGRFTLEGSRSAISLCLHAALRLFGKKGYEALVNRGMALTNQFADIIRKSVFFELIGNPELNIVNYRYIPWVYRSAILSKNLSAHDQNQINRINTEIQEQQFFQGSTFVSKTILNHTAYGKNTDVTVFRTVLSNPLTTVSDIYKVLNDQLRIASRICKLQDTEYIEQLSIEEFSETDDKTNKIDIEENDHFIPLGYPLFNCKIFILNQNYEVVPPGLPGELFVGGHALSRGYYNNPKLTNEHFIVNPFTPGELLFKTGDQATYSADGTIEFIGRTDDQVKIAGFRCNLTDIEYYLNQISGVENSAVVLIPASKAKQQLVAFIVTSSPISENKIRNTLQQKLPDYMVPSVIRPIEKFPLLPNGKVDKKGLIL